MAIKTVSAAGGIFSTGATWVGGVAPIAGDGIVANATSGNLTLSGNTVSLISADFTGYTGTFNIGNAQVIFNTAGTVFITMGSGMTLSFTTGYFNIQRTSTLTSNAKIMPIRYNASGTTLTLVGTLTISLLNGAVNGTITGADVILTQSTSINTFTSLIINSGYKMYWRPLSFATFDFVLPNGYFVFDTTNIITVASNNSLITGANSAITTIEFLQTPVWTGTSPHFTNGKPNFNISMTAGLYKIIATATFSVGEFQVNGIGGLIDLPIQIQMDSLTVSNNSASSYTFNIIGSGGISASSLYLLSRRNLPTAVGNSPVLTFLQANLKLTSDANFYFGTMSSVGHPSTKVNLSSFTASVPASVYISNSQICNTTITDINNLGTPQYAYTDQGNTLTSTTGFLTTAASSGGGSFTFVN